MRGKGLTNHISWLSAAVRFRPGLRTGRKVTPPRALVGLEITDNPCFFYKGVKEIIARHAPSMSRPELRFPEGNTFY